MKSGTGWVLGALFAALAGAGGYYAGTRGHGVKAPDSAGATTAAQPGKKLLYYRNPMGLADTSPTPKKDAMGMDYIAVYAGGADEEPVAANQVKISTDKVQKLGVRTEPAQLRTLDRLLRASGRVEPDERRVVAITPKFEGYVERLFVNVTGQAVGKGQPLFEVYSPELVSSQREYAIAVQGVVSLKDAGGQALMGMQQLADASLQRLRNWDISEAQIKALSDSGTSTRTLTLRSPVSGIVMEKKALQGMRFMPGEALYQIADLSAVWVIADVFEQDIAGVKNGARASVRINAYPDKAFTGRVSYVYPTLNPETRTVPVRLELANPGGLLKPGMFAQVELPVGARGQVVTVPVSAVIDSGTRQIVLVDQGAGRYESREVKLGARSDTHVEVRDGVQAGEPVVVAANFLIDAESNLQAALDGLGAKTVGHRASGTVDSVDLKDGSVSISHGPVASLKWPAMTMDFKTANAALLKALKPGARLDFEFVERQPGEWVITSVKP